MSIGMFFQECQSCETYEDDISDVVYDKKCERLEKPKCYTAHKEVREAEGKIISIQSINVQVCKPESKEQCETKYEENCKVTYATGKQCQKVPKKECKYVQVLLKNSFEAQSLNVCF